MPSIRILQSCPLGLNQTLNLLIARPSDNDRDSTALSFSRWPGNYATKKARPQIVFCHFAGRQAVYLGSDSAVAVVGQAINVDGGVLMTGQGQPALQYSQVHDGIPYTLRAPETNAVGIRPMLPAYREFWIIGLQFALPGYHSLPASTEICCLEIDPPFFSRDIQV
jgi:hypothetical protein